MGLPLKSLLGVGFSLLWLCCFLRFCVLLPLTGRRFLSGGIADFHLTLLGLTRLIDLILYRKLQYVDLMSCAIGWALWDYPRGARDTLYALWVAVSSFVELYRSIKKPIRGLELFYALVVVLMAWKLLPLVQLDNEVVHLWSLRFVGVLGLPLTWINTAPIKKVKNE